MIDGMENILVHIFTTIFSTLRFFFYLASSLVITQSITTNIFPVIEEIVKTESSVFKCTLYYQKFLMNIFVILFN